MSLCVMSFFDTFFNCRVNCIPKPHNFGVCLSPGINKRLKFGFINSHLHGTHCFQSSDRPSVTECKFRNFAFLPKMSVHTIFLNRYMKHL